MTISICFTTSAANLELKTVAGVVDLEDEEPFGPPGEDETKALNIDVGQTNSKDTSEMDFNTDETDHNMTKAIILSQNMLTKVLMRFLQFLINWFIKHQKQTLTKCDLMYGSYKSKQFT